MIIICSGESGRERGEGELHLRRSPFSMIVPGAIMDHIRLFDVKLRSHCSILISSDSAVLLLFSVAI